MSYIRIIEMLSSFLIRVLKFRTVRILLSVFLIFFLSKEIIVRWTPVPFVLAEWFSVEPNLRKTDVILVLSGGADQTRGVLEGSTLAREVHGITLWRQGYAPKILFSGGKVSEKYLNDSLYMKDLALRLGVPEESVLIEGKSRNTLENMRFSKKVMDDNGFETALLVTSPLHMRRSLFFAERFGMKAFPAPSPYWIHTKRPKEIMSFIKIECIGMILYRYFDEETIRKTTLFVRESFLFDWL